MPLCWSPRSDEKHREKNIINFIFSLLIFTPRKLLLSHHCLLYGSAIWSVSIVRRRYGPCSVSLLLSRIYARTILRSYLRFCAVVSTTLLGIKLCPAFLSSLQILELYILRIVVIGSDTLLEISEIALIGYTPVSLKIRFVVFSYSQLLSSLLSIILIFCLVNTVLFRISK